MILKNTRVFISETCDNWHISFHLSSRINGFTMEAHKMLDDLFSYRGYLATQTGQSFSEFTLKLTPSATSLFSYVEKKTHGTYKKLFQCCRLYCESFIVSWSCIYRLWSYIFYYCLCGQSMHWAVIWSLQNRAEGRF